MTALAGFIPFQIGDLKSAIEVVRRNSRNFDAGTPAIQAEWEGKTIPGARSHFTAGVQTGIDGNGVAGKRRDLAHLKILLPCIRAFLGETSPASLNLASYQQRTG